MPQSFGSLHCHIVFSTKHRQAQITAEMQPRLSAYVGGILRNQNCALVAAGGMPDHVHWLVSMSRTIAVSDVVRITKSNSSAWLHDEVGLREFDWQEGYGAFAGELFKRRSGKGVHCESGPASSRADVSR